MTLIHLAIVVCKQRTSDIMFAQKSLKLKLNSQLADELREFTMLKPPGITYSCTSKYVYNIIPLLRVRTMASGNIPMVVGRSLFHVYLGHTQMHFFCKMRLISCRLRRSISHRESVEIAFETAAEFRMSERMKINWTCL